ncbi:hypothetical protein HY745_05665 [Candidatus Desantisbacteria bacterium]|nr:hypothetical protein [Candidatus Desantisbacteria bacterium]
MEIGQTFFNKLVLRAGIVESTGGFGANYLLFKDKLSSGLTAFNFNSDTNNKPQLRFSNELNLFENGYLTFGVDDFINKERYYIGMRYLMEDKDIKYLMSLLSYR